MKLRLLDLFSGTGGFSLGMEEADFETVGFCEVDHFCREWLAQRWPGVPIYPNIRRLDGRTIGLVDVVAGGFPCQDISVAGKGEGLDGARSGLWFEMRRLVSELRPLWVVFENVPRLRTLGADRVIGDLEALGYTGWPFVVAGEDVGAPQRRKRVWGIFRRLADADRDALRKLKQRMSGGRADGVRDGWEAFTSDDGVSLADSDDDARDEWGEDDAEGLDERAELEGGGRLADAAGERERATGDEEDAESGVRDQGSEPCGRGELGESDGIARGRGEPLEVGGSEGRTPADGSGDAMADAASGGRRADGRASGSPGHADVSNAPLADGARHELGGGRGDVRWTRVGTESGGQGGGWDVGLGTDLEETQNVADGDRGRFEGERLADGGRFERTSGDQPDGRSGSRAGAGGQGGPSTVGDADGARLERLPRASLLPRQPRPLRLVTAAGLRWPARPGERQHDWEAERTVTDAQCRLGVSADGLPARMGATLNKARLKSAGNSVIPWIPYVIGRTINRIDSLIAEELST